MFRPEPSVSESCRRDWERYLNDERVQAFSLHYGPHFVRDEPVGARRVLQALRETLKMLKMRKDPSLPIHPTRQGTPAK